MPEVAEAPEKQNALWWDVKKCVAGELRGVVGPIPQLVAG